MTADLRKLSAGRADYYLREIARDREEYLSGQGESPGEWLGGSAATLGMRGECSLPVTSLAAVYDHELGARHQRWSVQDHRAHLPTRR